MAITDHFWLLRAAILATALLDIVSGAPTTYNEISTSFLEPPALAERQLVECNNAAADWDESCWGVLGLSDYLTRWIAITPKCGETNSTTRCCHSDEAWARCFMRLSRGDSTMDCSVLNDQHCVNDGTLSKTLDASIVDRVRYVQKNIYEINSFISTYYTGKKTLLQRAGYVQVGNNQRHGSKRLC